MEAKNTIYDRLLAIKIIIDSDPIPQPVYINEKIWECHRAIEEVEHYNIQINKETSVIQRAFNNAQAEYQALKEDLLNNPEIATLPSIRDREARANQRLKTELNNIKELQNELADLNNLLRAVDLKLKNLNRLNGDIRLQVRVLEAQVKINGATPKDDKAVQGLMEEMNKGIKNEDAFMDSTSTLDLSQTVDPTQSVDLDGLLNPENEKVQYIDEPVTSSETLPPAQPSLDASAPSIEAPATVVVTGGTETSAQPSLDASAPSIEAPAVSSIDPIFVDPIPEMGMDDLNDEEWEISNGTPESVEDEPPVIDLDKILEPIKQSPAIAPTKPVPVVQAQVPDPVIAEPETTVQKPLADIDMDALLDSIVKNEKGA
jgi:hypothetical protein